MNSQCCSQELSTLFFETKSPTGPELTEELGRLASPKDLPFSASSALRIKVQLFPEFWGERQGLTLLGKHFIAWAKDICSENYKNEQPPFLCSASGSSLITRLPLLAFAYLLCTHIPLF